MWSTIPFTPKKLDTVSEKTDFFVADLLTQFVRDSHIQ